MDKKVDNAKWLYEKFLHDEINNSLVKHGASDFGYLQEHVQARAEVVWVHHQPFVTINADPSAWKSPLR